MIVPNLYIVGFQKCGSTSLYELLNNHPQINGSSPKETFALVDLDSQRFNVDLNITNSNFLWKKFFSDDTFDYKYYMEASVCNYHQKTALEYIRKLKKKKIIFIVRNPISRFRSSFEYYSPKLEKKVDNIHEFLSILKNENQKNELSNDGAKYSLDGGNFMKYINKWEKHIDSKDMIIIKFEDLIKNTRFELERIQKFLDIDAFSTYEFPSENKTLKIKNIKLHFVLRSIFSRFRLGRFDFFQNLYKKLNTTSGKSSLNKSEIIWLKDYYKDELNKFYF